MYSRVEYSVWWMHRTRKFIARAQATNMMWCKIPLALALSERHQHIFVPVYESSCWNLFAGFAVQAFIRMFFQHIQFDVHICNKCSIVLLFFLWNCKDRLQMAVSTHAECVYRHRKKLTGIRTPQKKKKRSRFMVDFNQILHALEYIDSSRRFAPYDRNSSFKYFR